MNSEAEDFFEPDVEFSPGPSRQDGLNGQPVAPWVLRVASAAMAATMFFTAYGSFTDLTTRVRASRTPPCASAPQIVHHESVDSTGDAADVDDDSGEALISMDAAWRGEDQAAADIEEDREISRRSRGLVRHVAL